jgi:hypothetical protein
MLRGWMYWCETNEKDDDYAEKGAKVTRVMCYGGVRILTTFQYVDVGSPSIYT